MHLILLPNLLLKQLEFQNELRSVCIRELKPSRHLATEIEIILSKLRFRSEDFYFVVPYMHHISDKDSRTVRNFLNGRTLRNLDLVQVLSVSMQAKSLNFLQIVTSIMLDYERDFFIDEDDNDLGYLSKMNI